MNHESYFAEKPLKGYRVIDFTTNISGPSATTILSDLGAEVIKIEKIINGDDSRSMEPSFNDKSAYFVTINRGKNSIAINLKENDGYRVIIDLIKNSDIIIENFRRDTVEKLKLDYATIKKIKINIIYGSLSSYGNTGPYYNKPGYDAIVQANSGIMSVNGNKGSDPARVSVSLLDAGAGMWLAMGIIIAVLKKERTGKGSYISTSLMETALYWMNYYISSFQVTQLIPERIGSEHPSFAPYGAYKTSNGFIMIGISNNNLFSNLCHALGLEELMHDKRFENNKLRVDHKNE